MLRRALLSNLFDRLEKTISTSPLSTKRGHFVIDETIGTGLLFAYLFDRERDNYAIISPNQYSAQKTYEFLLNFMPEEDVVFFPADELLRAENLSSSRELLSQRLYAMGQLLSPGKKILVTHPAALLRFLPNPKDFSSKIIKIKKGCKIDLESLKGQLTELGYSRVNKIDQSLEFALRGDILDIFSVNSLVPVRVEFFDNEVESIRQFDIPTQSSGASVDEITILPATELLLTQDELTDFATRLKKTIESDCAFLPPSESELLQGNVMNDLEGFVSGAPKFTLYKYYGFAINHAYSILCYFNPKIIFVPDKNQFVESTDLLINESHSFFSELQEKRLLPSHLEQYMTVSEAFKDKGKVFYGLKYAETPEDLLFAVRQIVPAGSGISYLLPTVQSYLGTCEKVVLCLPDAQSTKVAKGFFDEEKIPYEDVKGFNLPIGHIGFSDVALSQGFEVPSSKIAYLSAGDLFGRHLSSSRFTSRFKDATILKSFEDLKPGDYVVHEYNGIGQFLGIKTMEIEGVHRDYLQIAYSGNEKLYVPLEQFRLVRKYAAREGAAPKLSHLSGADWQKKKAKIKERVNELADRLLALYSSRAKIDGFAFQLDDDEQRRFEDAFPYNLTADQKTCLEEIKADMEKPLVMDRLLSGDVGFGKTELAFRACYKAILGGKQAAILCPTTLLARQHYEVAVERFKNFGTQIAIFSRLIPEDVQKREMKDVLSGKVDLVIGTHRLLSKEIRFRDLGLLVVDEEQRFGVEQKEKIKELKKNVDVLTLSATPIPRTLQMSLVGIRPLSQINTAPENRMPIQTYVTPYKQEVVSELIQRELARNGQVFYVHNKVETIYSKAAQLQADVPTSKIGVVHGQMGKDEVEEVMEKFYEGELNVLVCTSIVENGIDIPNANMLIVEDADTFGLSQLYQIKGRVGRGDRIAYAYLMYKPQKRMNEDAQKRLQAIQEFTELGSGYKIAQRDLLIRGAGDIFGPEQAGFIDTVGLDLYLKMLNEAITEKTTGVASVPPKPNKLFDIDAYIPKEYASSSDKIELYQELEEIKDSRGLAAFCKHMRDVYGKPPAEVTLLIQKKRIDLITSNEEFLSVDEADTYVDIQLSDSFTRINGIGTDLFNETVPYLDILKVTYLEKKLRLRMNKREAWLNDLENIANLIHKLFLSAQERARVLN
jgi:transcription-repair coupling factor (superfamily II helicase)